MVDLTRGNEIRNQSIKQGTKKKRTVTQKCKNFNQAGAKLSSASNIATKCHKLFVRRINNCTFTADKYFCSGIAIHMQARNTILFYQNILWKISPQNVRISMHRRYTTSDAQLDKLVKKKKDSDQRDLQCR